MADAANITVTESLIYEALRECYDPEIPVNLVDLGLIYDGMIAQSVRNRVLKIEGVKEADVRIVWEPQWNPSMMTEEARKRLGFPAD
jgi:metal-sulfur cluster biosynthetic enzyme